MKPRKDDPEVMAAMRRWLQQASELAQVDGRLIAEVEQDLLKMTAHTAHELSRPGTPLTAFIAGVGAAMKLAAQPGSATDAASFSDRDLEQLVSFTREYVAKVMHVTEIKDVRDYQPQDAS